MKFFLFTLFFFELGFSSILDCSHEGFSYKDKISELMIVTYKKSPDFIKYMKHNKFGGIIGFSHDLSKFKKITDLAKELKSLREISELPLFMTIDQEGGLVQRLKKYKEMTYIPSAKLLGKYFSILPKAEGLIEARKIGELIGSELKSVGFNWNFGPSLDLDHGISENVITKYNRAFSKNHEFVAKYGSEIIKGMEKYVLSSAKHFPGQGISIVDTHNGLCYDEKKCPKFQRNDFKPFEEAIANGTSSVMIGHVYYANLDKNIATFSHKIVSGYLRQKFKFQGLVVSDDFTMGALGEVLGIKSFTYRLGAVPHIIGLAAEKALKAGVNVLVMSEFGKGRREVEVRDYLCKRISSDKELREKIDSSFNLVQLFKKKIKLKSSKKILYGKAYIRGIIKKMLLKFSKKDLKSFDKNIFKYYYF